MSMCLFTSLTVFPQSSPIRIVCMGNSITHGKIDKSNLNNITINQLSYRPCLWEKLDSAGINVDMVGFTKLFFDESATIMAPTPISKYTGHVFDRDHDSYYGITSDGLLNGNSSSGWTGAPLPKLADRLKNYTADIALLHIGTNDADAIVNTTVSNIEAIIDQLRIKNPNVVVFVAKLITTWSAINSKVNQIVTDKYTDPSPVIMVDLATGFINDPANPNTMTYDWVHPNPKGQQFMASRWFKAIQKQLSTSTGLNRNINNLVEVYPTVSTGMITLKNSDNSLVNVIDALGKKVRSFEIKGNNNTNVDLSGLNNGLYIVNINQNKQLTSKKILINK